MTNSTTILLLRKDMYLHRWLSWGSILGGILALALMAGRNEAAFHMGAVLMVTVLIAHGAVLIAQAVVEEHQQQTMPFVLSLPVSIKQYIVAKILANLLIFGMIWGSLLLGTLALFLFREALPDGLVVYVLVIFSQILLSTSLMLTVALITRSMPWTIGTMMIGNLVFNGFVFYMFRTEAFRLAAASPSVVWPPEALSLLFTELAAVALLLGIAYGIASRRKDIL